MIFKAGKQCVDCGALWENTNTRRCWRCAYQKQKEKLNQPRKCVQCEASFLAHSRNISTGRWCSVTCYKTWKMNQRVRYCPNCNKKIAGRLTYRQVACSVKCGIILRDKKHPAMAERRYKYKEDGKWRSLSQSVRDRDGSKCVVCLKKSKTHTDHLFPFRLVRSWGLDPNADVNLNSLCTSDHAKKTHAEQKLLAGDWLGFAQGLREMSFPQERLDAAASFYSVETRRA